MMCMMMQIWSRDVKNFWCSRIAAVILVLPAAAAVAAAGG
jgi:hypothetical protein